MEAVCWFSNPRAPHLHRLLLRLQRRSSWEVGRTPTLNRTLSMLGQSSFGRQRSNLANAAQPEAADCPNTLFALNVNSKNQPQHLTALGHRGHLGTSPASAAGSPLRRRAGCAAVPTLPHWPWAQRSLVLSHCVVSKGVLHPLPREVSTALQGYKTFHQDLQA